MNRAAVNIMKYPGVKPVVFFLLVTTVLAACGSTASQATITPDVQIVGDLASPTPVPTHTGTPTPLPSRTPIPTARQVTVSRVDPNINPAQVTPIAAGADLPNLALTDINGNELNLRELVAEGRPLVLNFWSVGCGSCFFEFPLLQAFSEMHGDNLLVIGINIADFPEETRVIGEQLGITFPQVVDARAELFTRYFNGAVVPTTIFIDGDGRVAQVVIGPLDAYNLDLQLQNIGLPSQVE
jgi:thiol-disulfide isomerase/thioredoxin